MKETNVNKQHKNMHQLCIAIYISTLIHIFKLENVQIIQFARSQ